MTITAELPSAGDGQPDPDAPARRGVLRIKSRAAAHLIEGVLARTARDVAESEARVTSISDEGVEVALFVTLEYPTVPLSGVVRRIRRELAEEAGRQLGRPIRHIDLTVSGFVTPADARSSNSRRRVI
jgi:hypothetical protein